MLAGLIALRPSPGFVDGFCTHRFCMGQIILRDPETGIPVLPAAAQRLRQGLVGTGLAPARALLGMQTRDRQSQMQGRQLTARPSYFGQFEAKMRAAGQPEPGDRHLPLLLRPVASRRHRLHRPSRSPARKALPSYELSKRYEQPAEALERIVILGFNGGLGTSMGMSGPKSLLPVKDELTFLDVIVRQALHLRRTTGIRLPLVLMNRSKHAARHRSRFPPATRTFTKTSQSISSSTVPRSTNRRCSPPPGPSTPEKEWCPPGHGDIYVSLITSGMLTPCSTPATNTSSSATQTT